MDQQGMHYHKEAGPGTGMMDSSDIGFVFHDKPVEHPIEISTIAHGAFELPPDTDNWRVGASRTFDEDTILLSMMPHMHLRGKAAKYTAFYPDGTSDVLLDVPEYDYYGTGILPPVRSGVMLMKYQYVAK